MNAKLTEWALRNGMSFQALAELNNIFGMTPPAPCTLWDESELAVQSHVRLEAGRKGIKLWRNNVGVLRDETGRPVRYGLANDSPALNKAIKSGDLIGWRPLLITPAHIGSKIAQFVSRECKRAAWHYTGTEHEIPQLRWIEAVNADGGDAAFTNGEGSL
jgi:hypothetical protein